MSRFVKIQSGQSAVKPRGFRFTPISLCATDVTRSLEQAPAVFFAGFIGIGDLEQPVGNILLDKSDSILQA